MYTFLLIILIIVCLAVVAAVLLQSGKGGGMAASFGGATTAADAFMGTRQAGNLLTRVSWWGGGLFLFLAFVLQLMSVRTRTPKSVLDSAFPAAPAPTAPQGTASGSAVPLTPNTTAPTTTTPPPAKK